MDDSAFQQNNETNDNETNENEIKMPKLAMWDFEQCDSKKCSGKKLNRFGLCKILEIKQSFKGIVLSPMADTTISPSDIEIVQSLGIAVIDCSWHALSEVPFRKIKAPTPRLC